MFYGLNAHITPQAGEEQCCIYLCPSRGPWHTAGLPITAVHKPHCSTLPPRLPNTLASTAFQGLSKGRRMIHQVLQFQVSSEETQGRLCRAGDRNCRIYGTVRNRVFAVAESWKRHEKGHEKGTVVGSMPLGARRADQGAAPILMVEWAGSPGLKRSKLHSLFWVSNPLTAGIPPGQPLPEQRGDRWPDGTVTNCVSSWQHWLHLLCSQRALWFCFPHMVDGEWIAFQGCWNTASQSGGVKNKRNNRNPKSRCRQGCTAPQTCGRTLPCFFWWLQQSMALQPQPLSSHSFSLMRVCLLMRTPGD